MQRPVVHTKAESAKYYSYYGQAIEYEQNQRAYEEAQNGNQNQNNNQYGYKSCAWYNFSCRSQQYKYMQYNDNGEGNNQILPNWFFYLGGKTEEEQRMAEEAGQVSSTNSAGMKFAYVWTLILFVCLVAYGSFVLVKRQQCFGIIVALLLFAQFSLMNLLVLTNGGISSDNRDLEESIYGWYGQTSVLMAYTDFWYIAYCILFSIAFAVRILMERRRKGKESGDDSQEAGEYQKYEAPEVSVTDKKNMV